MGLPQAPTQIYRRRVSWAFLYRPDQAMRRGVGGWVWER